jgi:hypothetical protein
MNDLELGGGWRRFALLTAMLERRGSQLLRGRHLLHGASLHARSQQPFAAVGVFDGVTRLRARNSSPSSQQERAAQREREVVFELGGGRRRSALPPSSSSSIPSGVEA